MKRILRDRMRADEKNRRPANMRRAAASELGNQVSLPVSLR
jgi:hypothetical protein